MDAFDIRSSMKFRLTIFFASMALMSVGDISAGMPFNLCIPASELAKQHYQAEKDQISFLRGFKNGVEMGLTDPDFAATYSRTEYSTPSAQGCKIGIAAVSEGGALFLKVNPGDLGYTFFDWKAGSFSRGPDIFAFKFIDSEELVPCTISSAAWNNWKATQKVEPDYRGDVWIRGWLSPEGRFGARGGSKRKIFITEVYKHVPRLSPEPKRK